MTAAPTPTRAAIILVNWNGWRDCIECLSSLYARDALQSADVWLVDNDSADGSVEHIVDWCARPVADASWRHFDGVSWLGGDTAIACRVLNADGSAAPPPPPGCLTIVRSGGNLGFAGGNNVGLIAAGNVRYTHFWLLNTDTVVRHGALDALLQRSQRDPAVGVVGSTLVYYHQPERVQALGGATLEARRLHVSHIGDGTPVSEVPHDAQGQRTVEAKMAYVVGASMLVTAAFVHAVGPMCESYFLYFEELDWALRGLPQFKLGYAPDSWVFHKVGGSSTQQVSEFSLNLLYRNQLRFAGRFFPEHVGAVRRKLALELVRQILRRRWMPARLVAQALLDGGKLVAAGAAARAGR